jgi:predicted RNA methylase
LNLKLMQLRDFFAVRAHFGWLHAALVRLRRPNTPVLRYLVPLIDYCMRKQDQYTQRNSARFDQRFGTQTYGRMDVPVTQDRANPTLWGYSAVNHDFFREILRAIPVPLDSYTFVDVGSGKGAPVLMASEFPFKDLVGVELNPELVEDAKRNVEQFNKATRRALAPTWQIGDFFQWVPPQQPCLFFFNNPFPAALTLPALQHLEAALAKSGHPALMVFRKAPQTSGDYLHRSTFWTPLRLAPYWRVYAANQTARHVS